MAHPDLDELLNHLLPFAIETLQKHGEFYPFGASMRTDSTIATVYAQTGDEHPPSQDLIDMIVQGLHKQAEHGEIRACGICLDVRTIPPGETEKTDAVCARLEHAQGEAVDVYLPYRKDDDGEFSFGELFAAPAERDVFGSDAT